MFFCFSFFFPQNCEALCKKNPLLSQYSCWIFLRIHHQIWMNDPTPPQQTHSKMCIFHTYHLFWQFHYQLHSKWVFLLQLMPPDDQSKGNSVFIVRPTIPPLYSVTTVCMLIVSFQDHFSTSFTSNNKIAWKGDLISLSDLMRKGDPTLQQCGILMQ